LLHVALLKSERFRLACVIGLLLVIALTYGIRILLFGLPDRWDTVLTALIGIALLDVAVYRISVKAVSLNQTVPSGVWMASITAELLLPALGIIYLTSSTVESTYRAFATPWILLFFPFVTLTTLRLSPRLSRIAGALSCVAYLVAAYHDGWRPAAINPGGYTALQIGVPFNAVILLANGFVAGAVAGEIRKHVEAALMEQQTRDRLKQIEHDLQIARSIQQSLLPRFQPTLQGFEIAGWNMPADATGGDYFDWTLLPDGRLAITLADVTGHGIGSALLASVCRAYSKASFRHGEELSTTVRNINRLLSADLTPPHYATFVAVICDEHNASVQLFSAGQGPLFMYSKRNDDFEEIDTQSTPLGLMAELCHDAPPVLHMDVGDMLLLVTDGFIEWTNNEGVEFGRRGVMQAVRQFGHLPAAELIKQLYQSVIEFANDTRQLDDLTAIVIKRTAAHDAVRKGTDARDIPTVSVR
jgi:serine phosphatase RsbU (regulator of sigma subunit)